MAVQDTGDRRRITDSLGASARASERNSTNDLQNRFLTIFVEQLRHQDPLNPMNNSEVTSQLAQMSTVNGIEKLSQTARQLGELISDGQAMAAVNLFGHTVLVPGKALALKDGKAEGGLELGGTAEKVTVTIKNKSGVVVRTIELGALKGGVHRFAWDGQDARGKAVPAGTYSMAVEAWTKEKKSITAQTLQFGTVSSVMRQPDGWNLKLGDSGTFRPADVRMIL